MSSTTPPDSEAPSAGDDQRPDTEYGPDDGLLVLRDLTKRFGGLTAVDDLSLGVEREEILGFIGPNGAGKSTTFNCVMGTFPPTSGQVWFDGEDVTGEPTHRMVKRGAARTFQDFRPIEDRSVVGNVALASMADELFTLDGIGTDVPPGVIEICERVGLGDVLDQTPDELSHAGMLRMELARALATDPDLLLIDEPFAGLSGTEVERVSDLFRDLRDDGLTLVVVDHNMRGLLQLIDRAVVINFGAKIADGPPEVIKRDDAVQEAYLGGDPV